LARPAAYILEHELDPHASDSSLRYMPGLDVIRGIAIVMVLLYHGASEHFYLFAPYHSWVATYVRELLYRGGWGVQLFFVLSGFLITGILLESRGQPDYFRNFYLRRVLRIAPAYLAILLVLFLSHSITPRYLVIAFLFLCNMSTPFGAQAEYGPFWSLSVEEQFYLFWPFVVWKISPRRLAWLSIGIVILTPFLRFAVLFGPVAIHDTYYKLWDVMDFFAAGACLALAVRSPKLRPKLSKAVAPLLLTGAILFVLTLVFPYSNNNLIEKVLIASGTEPCLFGFTGLVLLGYLHPGMATLAAARPLVFLANISYGLYLYHVFLMHLVYRHWPAAIGRSWSPIPLYFLQIATGLGLSIVLAYLSRITLEAWFLRLKPAHPSRRSLTGVPSAPVMQDQDARAV
jgi:peptidoglycan/LPS O-acetylase OafA/YrhL